LNRAVPPWDLLASDHFVAECVYGPGGSGGPAVSVCPDGRIAATPAAQAYLVDEEGRSSPDPFPVGGGSATPVPPCP
jgi:hypothetical protein